MEAITLEPELDRWLTEVAAKAGRAKQDVVREAVIRALEDLEDIEAADAVMARRRSGDDKVYSSAELRRDLGLDD